MIAERWPFGKKIRLVHGLLLLESRSAQFVQSALYDEFGSFKIPVLDLEEVWLRLPARMGVADFLLFYTSSVRVLEQAAMRPRNGRYVQGVFFDV